MHYHTFPRMSICAPWVKCVKTILSLCQLVSPPTRVTCIIWPRSQINPAWLVSCDAFHTAWPTSHDLHHTVHAAWPLSRTTAWLTSCDPHHLRDLSHMICVTIVTPPTWSTSRRCPRSQKWRLLGNYTAVNSWPQRYLSEPFVTHDLGLKTCFVIRITWSGSHSVTYIMW